MVQLRLSWSRCVLLMLRGIVIRGGCDVERRCIRQRPTLRCIYMVSAALVGWGVLIRSLSRRGSVATRPRLHPLQSTVLWSDYRRRRCACGVGWEWPPLHGCVLARSSDGGALALASYTLLLLLHQRLFLLGASVVVCELYADLAGIFALAAKTVPDVTLSPARRDDVLEIHPRLADEFRLLVVVEHRDLKLVVVGGVVDGEAQFLVPSMSSAQACCGARRAVIPSGRLSSTAVRCCLLCFFTQAGGTVRVLLSH